MKTPIDEAKWAGMVAECDGNPIEANPHTADDSLTLYWAWRIGWLWSAEQGEYEDSDEGRAEEFIEEQPAWERREALGVNDLVKRVKSRADNLARWLGMPVVLPPIDDARRLLREAVEDLLAVRNSHEKPRES